MANRSLLKKQIREAWRQSITDDYVAQRINSERSLQASLWSRLNTILPPKSRRMFIEPCMSTPGLGKQVRYPDLVICNSREIIGIIELKYQPRAKPKWHKDIDTFHFLATHRETISISNTRFRGVVADARLYPLANDVLFVWAGVHASCNLVLNEHVDPILVPYFMSLHAETRLSSAPNLR
jgi:hypothetical protein